MKPTSGFTSCDEEHPLPVKIPMLQGESPIGWYRNPAPWEDSLLVFTSTAIWTVEKATSERIPLLDILDYENLKSNEGVTGLRVRTKDGFRFLRVAGSYGPDGKYKDFLALVMILRAVIKSAAVPK